MNNSLERKKENSSSEDTEGCHQ